MISERTRRKMSRSAKRKWADPEKRAANTEGIRRARKDPQVRARLSHPCSEENREKASVTMRALWANPEYRESQTLAIQQGHQNPEARKKWVAGAKRRIARRGPSWKKNVHDLELGDFRSYTERAWARFFHSSGIEFEYEKRIRVGSHSRFPDFYLPDLGVFVEVGLSSEDVERGAEIEEATGIPVVLAPKEWTPKRFLGD